MTLIIEILCKYKFIKRPNQDQIRTKPGPNQDQTWFKPVPNQDQTRSKPGPNQDQIRTKSLVAVTFGNQVILKLAGNAEMLCA